MKFLVSLVALAFLSCSPAYDDSYDLAPLPVSGPRILELVNDIRATGCNCGTKYFPAVTEVAWNNQLEDAAYGHASYMERTGNFSHTGDGGSDAAERVEDESYLWSSVGENIAQGYSTEEAVFDAWMRSEGHCRNMMDPGFTEMGVARSGDYWVQVFGRPR